MSYQIKIIDLTSIHQVIMKNSILLIYIFFIYSSLGVTSDSLSEKKHSELSDNLNCKTCTLIVEKIESNLDADYFSHLEEFKNLIENISPFCNSLQKIKPELNCNLLNQFPNSKELTCGYLTNYCSQDFQGMYRNKLENDRNIILNSNSFILQMRKMGKKIQNMGNLEFLCSS